jgi:urease accessory protein
MEENKANQFGKTSKLYLTAGVKNGKTILEDVYFTAPFKIMNPFYESKQNDARMTVMCQTASAGIMEGDTQEHRITVRPGASMRFTSQAYEKIHKMKSGYASRKTEITVADHASLIYHPLPTLPFKDSAFESSVNVTLADKSSVFVMKEVLSCGRAARGERFQYRFYHNRIAISRGGELLYLDNTRYDPQQTDMEDTGMYEGFTHLGSLVMIRPDIPEDWIDSMRTRLDQAPDAEGGVTRIGNDGVVVRVLGKQADKLEKLLSDDYLLIR